MAPRLSSFAPIPFLLTALSCAGPIDGSPTSPSPDPSVPDDPQNPRADNPSTPSLPPECGEIIPATFEQRTTTPDVMLVVDRSPSMRENWNPRSPGTRWITAMPVVREFVRDNQDQMNFGLMLFPWKQDCQPGEVLVSPEANSLDAISQHLNDAPPFNLGYTPTNQSLIRIRDHYDKVPATGDGRAIVLVTDGLPNCDPTEETVATIESLLGQNVRTYVLGIEDSLNQLSHITLNAMARAGGTNSFFPVESPQDLSAALGSIIQEVQDLPSCAFSLREPPKEDGEMRVFLTGDPLERDDANGWIYDGDNNAIVLQGESCTTIQSGESDQIEIDFGCTGVQVD